MAISTVMLNLSEKVVNGKTKRDENKFLNFELKGHQDLSGHRNRKKVKIGK